MNPTKKEKKKRKKREMGPRNVLGRALMGYHTWGLQGAAGAFVVQASATIRRQLVRYLIVMHLVSQHDFFKWSIISRSRGKRTVIFEKTHEVHQGTAPVLDVCSRTKIDLRNCCIGICHVVISDLRGHREPTLSNLRVWNPQGNKWEAYDHSMYHQ